MVCMFCRIRPIPGNSSGCSSQLFRSEFGLHFAEINVVQFSSWVPVDARMELQAKTTATLLQAIFAWIFLPPFWRRRSSLAGFRPSRSLTDPSLLLGTTPAMTFLEGIDVEECQKIFILRHLVARDFAVDHASEYGCHMKICLLIASLLVVAYRLFEVPYK